MDADEQDRMSPLSVDSTTGFSTITVDPELIQSDNDEELACIDERNILSGIEDAWICRFRRKFLETRIYHVANDLSDNIAVQLLETTQIGTKILALFVSPLIGIGKRWTAEGRQVMGIRNLDTFNNKSSYTNCKL